MKNNLYLFPININSVLPSEVYGPEDLQKLFCNPLGMSAPGVAYNGRKLFLFSLN